jgi:hypothetical protein
MTAITKDIKPLRYGVQEGDKEPWNQPLGANVTVYGGTVAVTDFQGNVKSPDVPNSTDTVWGLIHEQRPFPPNPASSVAGTYTVEIDRGVFFLASGSGGDLLSQATVGSTVFLIDGQTVGLTSNTNTRPKAGVHVAVDANALNMGAPGKFAIRLGSNESSGA